MILREISVSASQKLSGSGAQKYNGADFYVALKAAIGPDDDPYMCHEELLELAQTMLENSFASVGQQAPFVKGRAVQYQRQVTPEEAAEVEMAQNRRNLPPPDLDRVLTPPNAAMKAPPGKPDIFERE